MYRPLFGQPGRLLDEKDGKTVYDYGLEKVVAKKIPHNSSQADVFERLVPFWQLKLYMIDVLKKENFIMICILSTFGLMIMKL